MRFRVNSDALVGALKLVQPGLLSNSRAGFSHVRVLVQPGKVIVSTSNDYGHFTAFVASEGEEEGDEVVYYHQLLDTVKPLHSMITVRSEERSLLIAAEGAHRHQASVQVCNTKNMPHAPYTIPTRGETFQKRELATHICETCGHRRAHERIETYQFLENQSEIATVSKKRLVQMVDQVAWLTWEWAHGDQKWQSGVCIELTNNIFTLVGMCPPAGALASEPVNGTWRHRVLVYTEACRLAMRAIRSLPKEAQVAIEAVFTQYQQTLVNDEPETSAPVQERAILLRLCTENFEVTVPLMPKQIPADYQKDFNRPFSTRVVCETANLRSAIEVISPAAKDHADMINLHIQQTKLTVEVPNKHAMSDVPLVTVDGPDVSVVVDASYLLPMLKKLPGSQIALECSDPGQPVVLRSCGSDVCVFRLESLEKIQQKES